MNKINKILTIISIFSLSSCVSLKMKETDLNNKDITVFNIKLNYNGKMKSLYPGDEGLDSCFVYFSGSKSRGLRYKIAKAGYKDNYFFVQNPYYEDIYLHSIRCSNFRGLYNKARLRRVHQKITSRPRRRGISYGGDIEIDWNSEIFKGSDLFNLSDMGIEDGGTFTMKIDDNYRDYINFMRSSYNYNPHKINYNVDKKLINRTFIDR